MLFRSLEAPVAEAALALVPREVPVDVRDGEFLAGQDVADGGGDVSDVVEAVVDAWNCQLAVPWGGRVKKGGTYLGRQSWLNRLMSG